MNYRIWIDADGCPRNVVEICREVGNSRQIEVWTVANFNHHIEGENHIQVDHRSQAADIVIANRVTAGDIVVTQDWGLGTLVLPKGARALSPDGRIFHEEQAMQMLELREHLAKHRRSGGRTRGPKKRTKEQDEQFRRALINMLDARGD